ncbi:hypothetical protein CRYPA_16 [uncultured Candidatus Thioglobus sp.]|nr:hypothetical protein CRYPA_16 [uncultured Candidatus Thioglobus sp.]
MTEGLTDWLDRLTSVKDYVKNMLKARKWIINGLVEDTSLTKKQVKKIVDGVIELVPKWLEEDTSIENGDRTDPYSNLEYNLIIIYLIRGNKSYSQEVYQYCDDDLKLINEMVNEDDGREEWLSIAHHKRLNVLIDKYMNRFDKHRESKKYNGIWY